MIENYETIVIPLVQLLHDPCTSVQVRLNYDWLLFFLVFFVFLYFPYNELLSHGLEFLCLLFTNRI